MSHRFKPDKPHRQRTRNAAEHAMMDDLTARLTNLPKSELARFAAYLSDTDLPAILESDVATAVLMVLLWSLYHDGDGMPEDRFFKDFTDVGSIRTVLVLEHLQRILGESVYDPYPVFEPDEQPLRVPQIIGMPYSLQLAPVARRMLARWTFVQWIRPDGVMEVEGPSLAFYAKIAARDLGDVTPETALAAFRDMIAKGMLVFHETKPAERGGQ
jgi:hypothetical protein